ncbi:MAG TPA: signal recognition particle-docking protein FtsY [Chloroflexota bacterium]|nr:signal recognition particle-docking protein FtsY [Chloroflexota bacterium]
MLDRLFRREKLDQGVEKSRSGFFGRIRTLLTAERPIDDDLWDELEELLIQADVGVQLTDDLMERLRGEHRAGEIQNSRDLFDALKDALATSLEDVAEKQAKAPLVQRGQLSCILVVGVNGVGKTTSIAKLGNLYRSQGYTVILAAGDTFRAAAIDQLKIWGERAKVPVVAHQPNADPGSVVFDALSSARSRNADLVIVDTAGRLHTKFNLMEELKKIRRVIDKQNVPNVTTVLVVDATTGQNAISQAQQFAKTAGLDGLIVTKLDGTAKGGVVFAVTREVGVPIMFVGTGEKIDDMSDFDADDFVDALVGDGRA